MKNTHITYFVLLFISAVVLTWCGDKKTENGDQVKSIVMEWFGSWVVQSWYYQSGSINDPLIMVVATGTLVSDPAENIPIPNPNLR